MILGSLGAKTLIQLSEGGETFIQLQWLLSSYIAIQAGLGYLQDGMLRPITEVADI
ncbi:MAG: hypothetical protein MUO58_05645 [Anaerolineales bacterium]|nr:hypothetical protein [Anaerolineales bacterium]